MRRAVTTAEIAEKVGVSRATVSYVLNGRTDVRISAATRERILDTARDLKWRPNQLAKALVTGRIQTIGVVVHKLIPEITGSSFSLYPKNLFLSIALAAARFGLYATLLLRQPGVEFGPQSVVDGRIDGLIVLGDREEDHWVRETVTLGLPVVEIGSNWGEHHVRADDEQGAYLAVEHLYSLGHRRIIHWMGEGQGAAMYRRLGFEKACIERNLDPKQCRCISYKHHNRLSYFLNTEDLSEIRQALSLPASQRPTALFTFNDWQAQAVLDVAISLGLSVPEDLSLVGFDNDIRAISMRPRLTTLINPVEELGSAAVALLQSQLDPALDSASIPRLIPTSLVVRDSTASPRVP
jgi:LacI family transcriptional regulator